MPDQSPAPPPPAREALMACPFCGACESDIDRPVVFDIADKEDIKPSREQFRFEVFCYGCSSVGAGCPTPAEAIAAWNRRATPAPPDLAALSALRDRWMMGNAAVERAINNGAFDEIGKRVVECGITATSKCIADLDDLIRRADTIAPPPRGVAGMRRSRRRRRWCARCG